MPGRDAGGLLHHRTPDHPPHPRPRHSARHPGPCPASPCRRDTRPPTSPLIATAVASPAARQSGGLSRTHPHVPGPASRRANITLAPLPRSLRVLATSLSWAFRTPVQTFSRSSAEIKIPVPEGSRQAGTREAFLTAAGAKTLPPVRRSAPSPTRRTGPSRSEGRSCCLRPDRQRRRTTRPSRG